MAKAWQCAICASKLASHQPSNMVTMADKRHNQCMQEVIKAACSKDDAGSGLAPKLRQVIVLMVSAAPRDSDLVKDVLVAVQHVLDMACSESGLPELLLSLLQLPDVCQVSLQRQITALLCTSQFSPLLPVPVKCHG